ncbi:hypothetical protein ABZP36_035532, partial [Zizania latifolia]
GGAAKVDGSVEVTVGGGVNREARGLDSQDDAEASASKAESPYLPSCLIYINMWTVDGVHCVSCPQLLKEELMERRFKLMK